MSTYRVTDSLNNKKDVEADTFVITDTGWIVFLAADQTKVYAAPQNGITLIERVKE